MPFLSMDLKCSMTGITNLTPNDPTNFRWHLKMKCTNCGEQPDHWQYVVANEILDIPGSRGEANLVEKCKLCGRQNTLSIVEDSYGTYKAEQNEKWQPMVTFDCRGVEPCDFDPRNDWVAEGTETGTPFNDIDLTEKVVKNLVIKGLIRWYSQSWADYDEKASESTEIQDWEIRFSHVKPPGKK
ncbi:hypothetical protein WR25_05372 [Diploscapter pachys]|uniref:CXXC motif containing zinc binding protein n=1 Tax=Diploscapter pachys TaxID=2018661 RepID=A0A2A2KAB0_9BILA|nr:hypothetical protein WR25_05372 [Diploscapter pachys]